MRMRLDIHAPPGSPRRRCPPGPCGATTCRHHLAGEAQPCSLQLAHEGPRTLEQIGKVLGGICRERVRQIEVDALRNFRAAAERMGLTIDALPAPPRATHWESGGIRWERGEVTPPGWKQYQNARYRAKAAAERP